MREGGLEGPGLFGDDLPVVIPGDVTVGDRADITVVVDDDVFVALPQDDLTVVDVASEAFSFLFIDDVDEAVVLDDADRVGNVHDSCSLLGS